jgi:hypothetical protein
LLALEIISEKKHMFGSGKKLKIADEIMEKLSIASEISGAASVDEFASRILEAEADRIITQSRRGNLSEKEVEDIANQLKGLGYID